MKRTIIGVFDHFQAAERVVSELTTSGFSRDQISLITPDEQQRPASHPLPPSPHHPEDHDTLTNRVGAGAVAGGVGGYLLTLAALAIPGVGPVLAAGPLIAALGGAGLGAAAGGLIGALSSAGVDHEDAHFYAEALRRGSSIVAVATDDTNSEQQSQNAIAIMNRMGAVDIDRRYVEYRKRGFNRFDYGLPPLTRDELFAEKELLGEAGTRMESEDAVAGTGEPSYAGGVRVVTHIPSDAPPPRTDEVPPRFEPRPPR
ncbi:MAG: hypothetical protein NDI61_01380 [Bdellovibrionaceae bacterium]|nr:hypothetical protein [Pseudobdellovibrionaceae bacterium]